MELNDLKSGWQLLHSRIEKNEILNRRIIMDMIKTRTQTAHSKLYRYELFSTCVNIAAMLIFLLFPFQREALILGEAALGAALVVQILLLQYLLRFDLEKKTALKLSLLTTRYKLTWKYNQIFGGILSIPLIIGIIYLQGDLASRISFIPVAIFVVVIGFFIFLCIHFFSKNIKTIESNLKELKEFEQGNR